jgi:hypothetical protein
MSEAPTKAPWHLWAVGIISLLWFGSGAWVLLQAQYGTLPGMEPDEIAYYAARPEWAEWLTDATLFATFVGSIALLLRSRHAVPLFTVGTALVVFGNAIEIADGSSRVYANIGALIATVIIVASVVFDAAYSHAMRRRGVLG